MVRSGPAVWPRVPFLTSEPASGTESAMFWFAPTRFLTTFGRMWKYVAACRSVVAGPVKPHWDLMQRSLLMVGLALVPLADTSRLAGYPPTFMLPAVGALPRSIAWSKQASTSLKVGRIVAVRRSGRLVVTWLPVPIDAWAPEAPKIGTPSATSPTTRRVAKRARLGKLNIVKMSSFWDRRPHRTVNVLTCRRLEKPGRQSDEIPPTEP